MLTPLKNNIVVFGLRKTPNAETPQAEKQAQLNTNEKIIKNKNLVIKTPSVLPLRRKVFNKNRQMKE